MGLQHEQARHDRDDYVIINLNNIEKGEEYNFDKTYFVSPGSYDFGSIMHYGSYDFSKNGKPTITDKKGRAIKTNSKELSKRDALGVNAVYLEALLDDIARHQPPPTETDAGGSPADAGSNVSSPDAGDMDAAAPVAVDVSAAKADLAEARDALASDKPAPEPPTEFERIDSGGCQLGGLAGTGTQALACVGAVVGLALRRRRRMKS